MKKAFESGNEQRPGRANGLPASAGSSGAISLSNKGLSHMKLTTQAMNMLLIAGALALAGQEALASPNKALMKRSNRVSVPTMQTVVGAGGMEVVTAATGGEAISASTAGGAWTTLTGPVITETYARDTGGPGLGTIVLNAPAGFEFNPNAPVTVLVTAQFSKTINDVPNGGTIPATVTPTTITIAIIDVSAGGLAYPDTLTYQHIQVRPTKANVLAKGNITESGTCQFRDLTLSSGTWGFLQEVGAVVPNLILADPLGDWDGDGRSNLMEYALGTDPTNPTDNTLGMQVWIMDVNGNKYLALGYRQRIAAGLSLQYVPEVSGDKQTWNSDTPYVLGLATVSVDAQFNWVTVRDTVPLTPNTPRFIRLTVIEN